MRGSLTFLGMIFLLLISQVSFGVAKPVELVSSSLGHIIADPFESQFAFSEPVLENRFDSRLLESEGYCPESSCDLRHACCLHIQSLLSNLAGPQLSDRIEVKSTEQNSGWGVVLLVPSPPPRYASTS